jgi:P4 family phage/plasmid primase-like protien
MSNPFRDFAPLYWAAGLPVIPLKRFNAQSKGAGKAPVIHEWQSYGSVMPSEAIQQHWLTEYGSGNIGLPFGPCSGLCAIDIDTLDEEQVKAIETVIPKSPWIRVGKKGYGAVFKWQGQRNFKIRDENNNSIVEFLGLGNQLVLPPSIHPDTKEPYRANTDLWMVLDQIPQLGVDIEDRLRLALGIAGFSLSHEGRSKPLDVVPAGERDIQLVRHAGYLSRVVFGIDKQAKFSLGEAVQQMHHWVENYTASVSGDDIDPDKGVSKLLEFILKDLEGGRTLPEGWDADLTEEQLEHPTIQAIAAKNEAESWTLGRAREWIGEQIAMKPTDNDWALARVEELVEKVAADENFSLFQFQTLCPTLQAIGKLGFGKTDLVKLFKDARNAHKELAADHEAIAREVVEDVSRTGELRWWLGSFWQWNGSCYERVEDATIKTHIAQNVKGNVLAKRESDYSSITKMVALLVRGELDEANESGVNFANGFLDIAGELHEHDPKYGKTFTMPFNYVPARATEAHKWMAFLRSCWGSDADCEQKIIALQQAFGVTMFGLGPRYQRAILLHGRGATGKSTALAVLQEMMPTDTVGVLPPQKWGERFALTTLIGKTLNVCGELPEAAAIDGERFKGVVVGEPQSTEYKGRDGFKFEPIATHWFASNHLPKTRDTSDAFIRRWLVLDFNRVIPVSERIEDFARILVAEEREAIAAWAVEGLRSIERDGWMLPQSHLSRENQILRSNNSVAAFLQSCEQIQVETAKIGDVRDIFDVYLHYMKHVSRGLGVTFERFKQMLEDLGYETQEYRDEMKVTKFSIHGVGLRHAPITTTS